MAASAPEKFAQHRRRWLATAAFVLIAGAAFALSLTFEPRELAAWLAARRAFVAENIVASAAAYFAFYVVFAMLSLPGAWAVSVAGGALFGAWLGVPLVALSSTAGATAAMLASRYLFREAAAARFPGFVGRVNRGIARDGVRWLLAARLSPIIPYFAINLAVGLTQMRAALFALITLIGAFPFALIYGLAGGEVAKIRGPGDLLSPPVLAALIGLAAAPFAVRALGQRRAARRGFGRLGIVRDCSPLARARSCDRFGIAVSVARP